jgi:endonuclease YncB( thermonuclease family)
MKFRTGLLVVPGLIAASALLLWLESAKPPAPRAVVTPAPEAVEQPAPAPAESPPPPPAPLSEPELSALPEVKVAERPIHAVPQEAAPPSAGEPLDLHAARPTGQSDEVKFGAHPLAPPAQPRQFSGTATATGGVELKVDATPVALFGIKRAAEGDHCGGTAADSDCATAARQALAERVSEGKVSCRIPNPHPGGPTFALCLDPNGVDLSGFLIAQGLALADTGQSYDYVGAEGIARNLKRGLWKFR